MTSITERIAATMADATERALWLAQQQAGDAYESATDGALHHAYPAEKADALYRAAVRDYDRASAALISYRQSTEKGK